MPVENADLLAEAYADFSAQQVFYQCCNQYARGLSPELFADPRTRALLRLDDTDTYDYNFAGVPIKVVGNRLNLAGFTVPSDDAATARLAELFEENHLDLQIAGFIRDVLTYGVSYASVWESDNPERLGQADISFESPLTTRVFYGEGDSRPTHAIKVWRERQPGSTRKLVRLNLYIDEAVYKYIADLNDGGTVDQSAWREYEVEGEEWPLPNPYGVLPVVPFFTQWQNPEPEHLAAWGVQASVNKLVSTHMSVIDALGLPIRYALVDPNSVEGTSALADLEGKNASGPSSGSDLAPVRARPGDILSLRAKEVGTFAAADGKQFIEPLRYYVGQLSPLTDIPLRHFLDPGQMPAEGSSLAADAPLRSRIAAREKSIGFSFSELMKLALRVEGRKVKAVACHWAAQEIELGKSFWEGAKIQVELGVPLYFVLKAAGVPETTLRSWGLSEGTAQVRGVPIAGSPATTADVSPDGSGILP